MSYGLNLIDVDLLRAYRNNTRTHTPEQVAMIVASIREFGWTNPVIVRDDTIAAGHGKALAARAIYDLGEHIYPAPGREAARLSGWALEPFPYGKVPIIDASGWSDEQLRAYVLADNQIALKSGWDLELLRLELEDLRELGVDLNLTGFEDIDLEAIFSGASSKADPEDAPEYRLTIASADEAEIMAVKKLLGVRSAEAKVQAARVLGALRDGD